MPLQRRHVRIPAAIALVALAALAILWAGARTPYARGLVERTIADAAGVPATVGRLRLGYFPSPRLDIGELSLAQPPGYGDEPLLEVGRLEVVVPWRRLFGATDRIDAVTVSQPTLRLRRAADGTGGWSKLFPEPPAGADPAEPVRWSLGDVTLEGGTIDYRDAASGSRWQITAISAAASGVAPGTAFPFELQLAGLSGPNTAHFALQSDARLDVEGARYEASALKFRGWLGGEPLPLAGAELTGTLRQASYDGGTGVAEFAGGQFEFAEIPGRFDGRLDLAQDALVADFAIATEAFAPRAPAIILGKPLPATADPAAFESLQAAFRVQVQAGELALDPLSGRLDDTNFEGRAIPGRRLVRASLDAIDFNRYLPPETANASTRAKKATLESVAARLAELDIDAELRIGEARVGGAKVRNAVIRIRPDGGDAP